MTEDHFAATWLALFQSESLEGLDALVLALALPAPSLQAVGDMHRVLHTLRGSAAMQGLNDLSQCAQQLETVFDEVRKGQRPFNEALRVLTLQCIGGLRAWVKAPEQTLSDGLRADLVCLTQWSAESVCGDLPAHESQMPLLPAVAQLFWIEFAPGPDLMRRGVDVLALLGELRDLGPLWCVADGRDLPELQAMEPDRVYLRWRMALCTDASLADVQDIFMFVAADSHVHVQSLVHGIEPSSWASRDLQSLLQTCDSSAQFLRACRDVTSGEEAVAKVPSHASDWQTHMTVPVSALDKQLDLLGELVNAQASLAQSASGSSDALLRMAVDQISRLTTDLRSNVAALRRAPAACLVTPLFADVQTHAMKRFCQASCSVQGQDTALDISLLSELYPHLSVWLAELVAGLTPSEDPAEGLRLNLTLSSVQEQVLWRFEIDGLRSCLTEPLDLFRTVQAVGGMCQLEQQTTHDGVLMMRLPLARGIVEGLLVSSHGYHYVLPMNQVEEVVDLKSTWSKVSTRQDVLDIRGGAVPFVRLAPFLGLESDAQHDEQGHVVIVSIDQARLGIQVDKVWGQQQTVIKRLNMLGEPAPYLAGTTLLADGNVAMVLDVLAILQVGIQ